MGESLITQPWGEFFWNALNFRRTAEYANSPATSLAELVELAAPVTVPHAVPDPVADRIAGHFADPVTEPMSVPVAEPEHVSSIRESGLFDHAFYAEQLGRALDADSCVRHYLLEGAAAGFRPNRLFDAASYLATHADVAASGMDAFFHYVSYGIEEGRQLDVPANVLGELKRLPLETLVRRRVAVQAQARGFDPAQPSAPETVAIFASSLGNFFFRQIADRLAAGFRATGCRVYRLDQNSQRPDDVTLDFVVAPHEFFLLGAGPRWRSIIDVTRSVVFNTEQPGTPWYFRALRYGAGAGMLVDLSPQSAALLPGIGFPKSGFLPLGPVAGAAAAPQSIRECVSGLEDVLRHPDAGGSDLPWEQRPIDVLFLGTLTSRRSEALARLAPTLAQYRCFIHAPTGFGRPLRGAKGQIDEAHSRYLASQSKILVNIHRGEFPYFEWHRIVMLGAEQGAVVVSERSLPVPGIRPGCHYLPADIETMPAAIERLLGDEGAGLARTITARCRADLATHLDLGVELRALMYLHRNAGTAHA